LGFLEGSWLMDRLQGLGDRKKGFGDNPLPDRFGECFLDSVRQREDRRDGFGDMPLLKPLREWIDRHGTRSRGGFIVSEDNRFGVSDFERDSGRFDDTGCQHPNSSGKLVMAKGLIEPNASQIAATLERQQNPKNASAVETRSAIQIDHAAQHRGPHPVSEFQNRLPRCDILVIPGKEKKEVHRAAQAEPFKQWRSTRPDARDELQGGFAVKWGFGTHRFAVFPAWLSVWFH
jgi:hypothetical protein